MDQLLARGPHSSNSRQDSKSHPWPKRKKLVYELHFLLYYSVFTPRVGAWIKVSPFSLSPSQAQLEVPPRRSHSWTKPVFGAALGKVNDYLFLAMMCVHAYVLSFPVHSLPGDFWDSGPHIDGTCPDLTGTDREEDQAGSQHDSMVTFDKTPFLGVLDPVITTLQLWHPVRQCRGEVT